MAIGVVEKTRTKRARPILIVDDDAAIRETERELLAEHGFRAVLARDGAEALRAIEVDPPAMVILDIQMPGVDGPAFARTLRQQLRHVPLVILTGVSDPKHQADLCNAEAYLRKPFDAAELVALVKRFSQ